MANKTYDSLKAKFSNLFSGDKNKKAPDLSSASVSPKAKPTASAVLNSKLAGPVKEGFRKEPGYAELKKAATAHHEKNFGSGSKGLPIKVPAVTSTSVRMGVTDKGRASRPNSIADRRGKKGQASDSEDSPAGPKAPDTETSETFALSLRYQMPKKLENLSKLDLKKLSQWIANQIRDIETERTSFMDRLLKYRDSWLNFMSAGMQPVWEGAHNLHVPVTFEKIKAMHARIYQAVLGIEPPFSLKPKTKISEIQKYEKEQLLNFVMKDLSNYGRGWESVVDKDIHAFVADGTSITKQEWKRDVRKYSDVNEKFVGFKMGQPQYEEVEEEKEEIIFDGPVIRTINIEDFFIAGTNIDNPDSADIIGERSFYSKSELVKLAQQGFFFKEALDKILKTEPMNASQLLSAQSVQLKEQAERLSGIDPEQSGIKTYEIEEVYCRYDIDNDGIDEELVVWREKASGLILRLTYLERACPGALRPYTIKKFIDRPGSPFGIGMAELMYGISNGIDYIANQRLDYGTLQNLPFGFVRSTSGTKPKEMRLAPGVLYPVDDPQTDVFFPRLNGGTAYGFQEEQNFKDYGDKVSGLSGFNLGSTTSQGPTRTATGTAALVAETNANLDIYIKRFQRGYKRNLKILDMQIQQLLPLGTIIRVSGMDGKEILTQFENRKAIQFNSDFELTANSVNSNKAVERDTAQMLLQILQNPLNLQGGLVTPQNLYNANKRVLQAFEIRDIDAYITKPADAPDSPYSAKDELTMILSGIKPTVYMKDRHQEKLAFFQEFENSEDFSWFGPEQIEIYRRTKADHEGMMNSIAAQAAQTAQSMGGAPGAVDPMLSAQLAAGGGNPAGVPAQQIGDLAPQQGANKSPV